MNILFFLVPIALLLAAAGVLAFWWSVRNGQYDDVQTPAIRMLLDDEQTSSYSSRLNSNTTSKT